MSGLRPSTYSSYRNSQSLIALFSMTYSDDFRWRAVALMHVYDVSSLYVSEIFGPKQRALRRWYALFLERGIVNEQEPRQLTAR